MLRAAALVHAVHVAKRHSAVLFGGRREREKSVVVEVRVGKSDKAFVMRTIMPGKPAFGHTDGEAVVEYAFEIFRFEVFVVAEVRAEKRRGRELFGIAYDDNPIGAGDRSDRFTRLNL